MSCMTGDSHRTTNESTTCIYYIKANLSYTSIEDVCVQKVIAELPFRVEF